MKTPSVLLDRYVEMIAHQKGIYDAAGSLLSDANRPPNGTYNCNCCEGVLEVGEGQTCGKCQYSLYAVRQESAAERQRILRRIAKEFGQATASLWDYNMTA